MNITRKIDLKKLFHVKGKENCSDVRTRTDKVLSDDIKPNSDWLMGKPWMKLSLEEATTHKFIRPIVDLKLTHEGKGVVKKRVIFNGCDNDNDKFAVIMAVNIDLQKTMERSQSQLHLQPHEKEVLCLYSDHCTGDKGC